ncbi:respiratory supercomplex factor 2 homolog C1565.01-like [Cicer arietinum]|uniref:Uncharacterized protein LOC101494235 n=1 Tax=Cicer arietinum TaxID=3827 RepID=A0A1S2XMP9_CICAR|nr:uncharacterized protein LOC101494235 [Cicer arietinum]
METIQSWVSKHKLAAVGGVWASGIGGTLLSYSRTRSPMKPSLRLIHARMHAQALTLAVLSGVAAYRYYENYIIEPKPQVETTTPNLIQMEEWELLCPF